MEMKNIIFGYYYNLSMRYTDRISVEVFEKDGEYYISEVNPRFGGGYVHAYAAGVDFPKLLINNMNGIANEAKIGLYKEEIYMMKYFAIKVLRKDELRS